MWCGWSRERGGPDLVCSSLRARAEPLRGLEGEADQDPPVFGRARMVLCTGRGVSEPGRRWSVDNATLPSYREVRHTDDRDEDGRRNRQPGERRQYAAHPVRLQGEWP